MTASSKNVILVKVEILHLWSQFFMILALAEMMIEALTKQESPNLGVNREGMPKRLSNGLRTETLLVSVLLQFLFPNQEVHEETRRKKGLNKFFCVLFGVDIKSTSYEKVFIEKPPGQVKTCSKGLLFFYLFVYYFSSLTVTLVGFATELNTGEYF